MITEVIHRCTNCDYETPYLQNLKRHMVRHQRQSHDDPLMCDWCYKVFANRQNRTRHMNMHCPRNPSIPQDVQKVDSHVLNVDSHVLNVDSRVLNVDSRVLNVDSDVQIVDSSFIPQQVRKHVFPCGNCFRVFNRPSKLEEHRSKCKGVTHIYECHKCHQIFSSSSSKSHHVKRCTVVEPTHIPHIVNNTNNHNTTNNNTYNTTIINDHSVNNINTININGIGKEFLGHLTPDFLGAQALKYHGDGILKCIEYVHFNPDFPENQNLRAVANPDVPKKTIAVFEEEKWTLRDMFFVMRPIIQNYVYLLKHHVSQEEFRKRTDQGEWMQIWTRLSNFNMDSNPNEVFAVIRETQNLLSKVDKVYVDV